jgi:hypothetical protein
VDGTGVSARFWSPSGIAVDGTGKLYVSDSSNSNDIRVGTPAAVAVNISTRIEVGTDSDVLIGGFIVTGVAPKKVIIRALGPSLQTNGQPVPGRLLDPLLELHGGDGSVLQKNDDWRTDQEQEISNTGLAPTDDREAAIVATLQPGFYTAVVQGAGATTGIGLVEIYDLDATAPAQIAQISTRGNVLTGDNVMIGGFILSGKGAVNVLIRAIGPELAQNSGVSGALADPVLELHNANGDLVRMNDDWRTDQQQQIEDTGIPPKDDRESAILETLGAGPYTAIVSGKDQSTGVALVEVYVLQ